jgi:hypothetical protein
VVAFPIIPLAVILGGGAAATILAGCAYIGKWYFGLPRRQRAIADRRANELAMQLYNKRLDRLSDSEKRKVIESTYSEMS